MAEIKSNLSPLSNRTLLGEDYGMVELNLIYIHDKAAQLQNSLVFAVFAFIPKHLEIGPETIKSRRLGGSSNYTAHFRRIRLSVDEALAKYSELRSGRSCSIPHFKSETGKGDLQENMVLSPCSLAEEPAWPFLT